MKNLKDVAHLAQVSTATVSRVINNTGYVADKTKQKVIDAINELEYHPNVVGRQLRTKETKTVLVIVPDITNVFFSKILSGIQTTAKKNGYQILLGDIQNNVENEKEYYKYLYFKQVDGLILLSARNDSALLEQLSEKFPVVLASEYVEGIDIATVSIDNVSSARKVTDYLIHLKHQRIAHITGPLDVILSRDRLKGYRQSLLQNNIEIEPNFIQEGDFSFESGYNIMKKLLALESPPTAVFSANDEMAIGALKFIKTTKLSVPQDISVMGFDDIPMSSAITPSLSTFSQPSFGIGEKSMDLLVQLMKQKNIEKSQFILEGDLIIRESSKK